MPSRRPKKRIWTISTGKAGFGTQQESGCTPIGLHRICEAIGNDAPLGTVFKGRQPTGQVVVTSTAPHEDYITTRILWLEGLEEGFNKGPGVDTRERYIYIHGTPHTALLGQPASAGCIRMKGTHIMKLFQYVQPGTLTVILPPST
ncbi:MAG: L,D-transpeptidase [Magnetococcales bacterium]|nr:L,D-transpeptidase [Magnetococcales bacterium]